MIRYHEHDEIDKPKWDECIEHAVNGIIYARSWYLDIVSPGWDALVEDDYLSVFPLTFNRKFLIRYLYQPFFTQQLGIFTRNHLTLSLVDDFLKAIPEKFSFAEISLNAMNKVDQGSYEVKERINLQLDLIPSFENIQKNFDQNTKRNIKKSLSADLIIRRNIEPDELITLFRQNFGKEEGKLKFRHYDTLRRLMIHCLQNTFSITMGAVMPDGSLCAGVFFLRDRDRWIFHFAASDRRARENGAMFRMLYSFLKEQAGQAITLDFEGSNDENVARFYRGFGASECNYYQVRINRLPYVLRKVIYFRDWLRRR